MKNWGTPFSARMPEMRRGGGGRGRERKGEEGRRRGRKTKRKEEEEEGTNGMGERGWRGGQMRESHALCVRVDMSASYKI